MSDTNRLLKEKTDRLNLFCQYIKPGAIIECGCGSGFVLEFMSSAFPDSQIVGIDNNLKRLKTAASKGLKNVHLLCGDLTDWFIKKQSANNLLYVDCIHVICSNRGKEQAKAVLFKSFKVLDSGNVLIIDDFLKPEPQTVKLSVKNKKIFESFQRFVEEFQPRTVNFKTTSNEIELDIADALEFIWIYPSFGQEEWHENMHDSHFFFTEKELFQLANTSGLKILNSSLFFEKRKLNPEINKIIEFNFEYIFPRIQLILEK